MPAKPHFEELDYRQTPLGELILRRRTVLMLDGLDVYEVILGDEFLMSSMFHEVEVALADQGLAALKQDQKNLEVVVGGLGLGYTARAALKNDAVKNLFVVDFLEPVIEWHQAGLVPLGNELTADKRCHYVHGDFFKLAQAGESESGFDPSTPGRKFHAVLLDIDHSPSHLLHERHAEFYSVAGLQKLTRQLHPGGVFALWSNDPPEEKFMLSLDSVFGTHEAHEVSFHNPLQNRESKSTVYVAKLA